MYISLEHEAQIAVAEKRYRDAEEIYDTVIFHLASACLQTGELQKVIGILFGGPEDDRES